MRLSTTITTMFIASALAVSPVSAQGHGGHGKPTVSPAKPPHSTASPANHTTTKPTSKPTMHAGGKPSTTTTTTMNPIATKIASHPQLKAKVMEMIPAGMTLDQASAGFRNQGQFIAALHAADHMNCDTCFAQLKTDMVDKGMSLGQSIQDVRHTNSTTAQTQARTAEREADTDLKVTTTQASTSTSKKKPHGGNE